MISDAPFSIPVEPDRPPTMLKVCVILLTVCAVGAVSTYLRTVITPLLMGLLLFFLVLPLVESLDNYRVPRWLIYILLCVIGVAAVFGMGRLIEIQGRELRARLPEYQQRLQRTVDRWVRVPASADSEGKPNDRRIRLADMVPVSQDDVVKYVLSTTMELIELSTMAIFYLLFALMESRYLEKRMQRSLSTDSASRLWSAFESIKTDMRSYLWIKTFVSAGLGLTTALLGWLFGLDFWLLWGCLMFLSNYVTYIGSMVALVPVVLVAFAQFDSAPAAAGLTALLILNRLAWIDYAEMRYSGKYVDVSPLLVLFSVALMGALWGMVGMLLAVPLIATCRILLDSFPNTRFLARLISDVAE